MPTPILYLPVKTKGDKYTVIPVYQHEFMSETWCNNYISGLRQNIDTLKDMPEIILVAKVDGVTDWYPKRDGLDLSHIDPDNTDQFEVL